MRPRRPVEGRAQLKLPSPLCHMPDPPADDWLNVVRGAHDDRSDRRLLRPFPLPGLLRRRLLRQLLRELPRHGILDRLDYHYAGWLADLHRFSSLRLYAYLTGRQLRPPSRVAYSVGPPPMA